MTAQAIDARAQLQASERALERVREILTAEYRVQNILKEWICDLCGGDLKWPEHKPECTVGQVLALASPGSP